MVDCNSTNNYLVLNTDISGLGVRISFYLQTFLLVLLVNRSVSREEAISALWTFIATSFGLTISAVVLAATEQLTLFQALHVLNLVCQIAEDPNPKQERLSNFGTFLALASYSRCKSGRPKTSQKGKLNKQENYVKLGAIIQTLLSMVLSECLWYGMLIFPPTAANLSPRTYANQLSGHCTPDVHYVLFVFKMSAKGKGRIVALVLTSLLFVGYIVVTAHELLAYYRTFKLIKLPKRSSVDSKNVPPINITPIVVMYVQPGCAQSDLPLSAPLPSTSHNFLAVPAAFAAPGHLAVPPQSDRSHKRRRHHHSGRPKRKQWLQTRNHDPMFLGIAAAQIIIFAYFVVSTEMLLLWNPYQSNGPTWGFGQVCRSNDGPKYFD
ncbi:hypothetical protein FIBSPDRAFT_992929 [Athelia psychrophila]|uniref:Uncharacterized protein n=1 Tax=Athelia psychrophila TaxID=1759441 RepID=A0A166RYU7_9AGAM|nr:hypothetical protein FIBSPDRAFT_992929 [Fibularhizoctonia sp. CBS 109695]